MKEKYTQEEIDLYINNQLEGKELTDFEQEMTTDKTLARKTKITSDLNKAMDDYAFEQDLAAKLKIISVDYPNSNINAVQKTSKHNSKWWIIVPILLLIGSAIVYFLQPDELAIFETNEEIFAAYYEPYSSLQSDRSSTAAEDYKTIIERYDNQKYSEVVPLLEAFLEENAGQPNAKLLLGNAYLNTSPPQIGKAIQEFQEIINGENQLFTELAQWYLALAYLKNNDNQNAQLILETLAKKSTGRYPKLAQKLLSKF